MGRTACTDPQFLYSIAISLHRLWAVGPVENHSACTVQLYLYSPYAPYGLYRPSGHVQYSYTSTHPKGRTACTEPQCVYSRAIPLLPLWSYGLYRVSVPAQSLSACTEPQCVYSRAIPLLPLWSYGLYRASVPVQYSYTSNPTMGCTACTEPQCLYRASVRVQ